MSLPPQQLLQSALAASTLDVQFACFQMFLFAHARLIPAATRSQADMHSMSRGSGTGGGGNGAGGGGGGGAVDVEHLLTACLTLSRHE